MTKESNIQREIMLEASRRGDTVWRNNVGKGWVAPPDRTTRAQRRMTVTLQPGDVVLRDPYRITWGLSPGSSDLIGIHRVVVTEEMVGSTIGQFMAMEVKTATGRTSEKQDTFLKHVRDQAGLAKVVRSVEDLP